MVKYEFVLLLALEKKKKITKLKSVFCSLALNSVCSSELHNIKGYVSSRGQQN